MKFTSPFSMLMGALNNETRFIPVCFIDETEVAIKECGVEMVERIEVSKLNYWDKECKEHPTSSHCKVYDH